MLFLPKMDRENCASLLSLPPRGAWIEILKMLKVTGTLESRPPRGAWIEIDITKISKYCSSLSLPPRGAWIEIISGFCDGYAKEMSLPPRGAWIEIPLMVRATEIGSSLPPRGAWIEMFSFSTHRKSLVVAPPTGSVD